MKKYSSKLYLSLCFGLLLITLFSCKNDEVVLDNSQAALDSITMLSPNYIKTIVGSPVEFKLNVPVSDGITYTWIFNKETFSTEKNPIKTFTSPGSGDVTVLLKHSSGKERVLTSKLFLAKNKELKVLGYHPSYRPYANDQTMWKKITHVCLCFAVVKPDGEIDITSVVNNSIIKMVNDAHANGVYVLLSLGGTSPETGSYGFTDALNNPGARSNLLKNLLKTINHYDLNGIDLDYEHWEYSITPNNNIRHNNLKTFYTDLRAALPKDALLTAAVNPTIVKNKYFTAEMLDELDYLNLMTYDKTGDWESSAIGPHAHMDWVNVSMGHAKASNLDKKKILLGVPFYGKIFPNAPYATGAINVAYRDIVAKYVGAEDGCSIEGENLFYDGKPLITEKTNYVIDNQMGGVMIWELSYDSENPSKSLLNTIDNILKISE